MRFWKDFLIPEVFHSRLLLLFERRNLLEQITQKIWYRSYQRQKNVYCKNGHQIYLKIDLENQTELSYFKYTFDKFAEKIDGRVLDPSTHVLASLNIFFLKLSTTDNLPVARVKQLSRSMKKKLLCVRGRQSYPSRRNSTTSGTGSVRISSQGLFSS